MLLIVACFFFLLNDLMVSNFSCDKAAGQDKKTALKLYCIKNE